MKDLIRDATLGQIIRLLTQNKVLQYPEERPDFQCPHCYNNGAMAEKAVSQLSSAGTGDAYTPQEAVEEPEATPLEKTGFEADMELDHESTVPSVDLQRTHSRMERDVLALQLNGAQNDIERAVSRPIEAKTIADGTILVDWYTTDDPENPRNWSTHKKIFAGFQICLYTFAVYTGSSLYASSEPGVMAKFHVGNTPAALGLALYVLAYGIGPLLFSPLSEIPSIGRNPPYIVTFALFVILCVPAALVQNFAGLLVLRFLLGFFGSPCLATGGASLQDLFPLNKVPYALVFWAGAATCGPALGPVIAGYSVQLEGWRFSFWELLWLAGPVWLLLFLALPETSESNILLRRAKRLRKLTGNLNLKSQSEIDQANMTATQIGYDALLKPWEINIKDPAVMFSTFYTALVYAIYYSFFESVPLVYPVYYGFNLGESGLLFITVAIGLGIAAPVYAAYFYFLAEPPMKRGIIGTPESFLRPGMVASFLPPIGLFIYAWTSRPSVHWIVSLIGLGINIIGTFIIFQSIFLYIPFTYPKYSASLFAANDFARSSLSFAAILFARPMFVGIGVAGGVSFLAGLTILCIGGIFLLYIFGEALRRRSKFAQ